MTDEEDKAFDPTRLNLTELVSIASAINPEAHRALPREILEVIALGEEIELPQRTLNKKRLQVMSLINERWASMRYQISCPAISRHPEACFNCSDLQISSCTLDNRKLFEAQKRKP